MNSENYSEWKVSSNPVGGKMMYCVYRLRDKAAAIDHSGNREIIECFDNRDEAERMAAKLNLGK